MVSMNFLLWLVALIVESCLLNNKKKNLKKNINGYNLSCYQIKLNLAVESGINFTIKA